jgi:hypothetical protein
MTRVMERTCGGGAWALRWPAAPLVVRRMAGRAAPASSEEREAGRAHLGWTGRLEAVIVPGTVPATLPIVAVFAALGRQIIGGNMSEAIEG